MARKDILARLVSSLLLILLFRGCGSDSGCPEEKHITVGRSSNVQVTSPNYPDNYGSNQHCNWKITTHSALDVVSVDIKSLHLEDNERCFFDSLSIYDSDGPTRLLAKLCGSVKPRVFLSTGQHMYLSFVSDHTKAYSGFMLVVSAVEQTTITTTNNTTTTATTPTTITTSTSFQPVPRERIVLEAPLHHWDYLFSSDYDYSHFTNGSIQWIIQGPSDYVIHLRFLTINLQTPGQSGEARVIIYDTDKSTVATISNSAVQGVSIYSSGSTVYVDFTTDSSGSGKGFALAYQSVRRSEAKPRTTQRRYTTTTTTTTTTSSESFEYTSVILMTVFGGSSVLLICCCVFIGACCRRKGVSRPAVGRPAATTPSTRCYSHNNSNNNRNVYVVPRQNSTVTRSSVLSRLQPSRSQTLTNPAFSADSEAPPPYSSLPTATVQVEREDPPPPYSQAMIRTQPPSYKEVTGEDTAAQSVSSTDRTSTNGD